MTSENQSQEKREFSRAATKVAIEIMCPDLPKATGTICNVSMNGVSAIIDTPLPLESTVEVRILLEGGAEVIPIEACGTVIRMEDSEVAIAFTNVEMDSVAYLRDLILYNAFDVPKAEEEFNSHLGLKRM